MSATEVAADLREAAQELRWYFPNAHAPLADRLGALADDWPKIQALMAAAAAYVADPSVETYDALSQSVAAVSAQQEPT